MKNLFAILLIITICSCQNKEYKSIDALEKVKNDLTENANQYLQEVKILDSIINKKSSKKNIQNQFKKARLSYKKIESTVAFYFPETAENLNGAPIDKNEVVDSNRKIEEASGFQKVEELIFSDTLDFKEIKTQTSILSGYSQLVKTNLNTLQLSDSNIFEAQKLELLRLMSLGITGFDSPIALHSLPECKSVLQSISQTVSHFKEDKELHSLTEKSVQYLDKNSNFNSFDRATFITQFCIPISKKIYQIQKELKIKNNPYSGAINFDQPTIFEETAFNLNYFAPTYNRNPTSAQIALGEALFSDTILSGNNQVSCATCHISAEAYADHNTKAVENGKFSRNTPTLLNSGFQNALFTDGRVNFLEDQAKAVINNKDEMHGSFSNALQKVQNNALYKKKFEKVFPKDTEITEQNLLKSLASYVRSLSKLNSKFDDYLRGKTQLTQSEKDGFNLYMGKAKCATCHFFPLFNGSVPPLYDETESEVLGVPSTNVSKNGTIDSDLGVFLITKAPLKKHAFKTPTVRNSAITFPYMHNGVYQTLEQVIDFYNRGGGAGIGINTENQTLPTDKLNLTKSDIKNLTNFIKTLNNTKY